MDTIDLIGSTMGLGFVAGVRLYATIFALGLAIRFDWLHLSAGAEPLRVLVHPMVLLASGVAFLAEFLMDKIPWVDSIWDGFHTFIRPIGAAILAAAVFGRVDPALRLTLIILCGGVAFASHSAKAATRLLVNQSPEPFSNIGTSLAEDAFMGATFWLTLRHPVVTLAMVLMFLSGFGLITRKVYRSVRLRWLALWACLRRVKPAESGGVGLETFPELKPEVADALRATEARAPDASARPAHVDQ